MEMKMQSIHMNRVKCRDALRLTVDDDVNVPDNKADVRAVIWKKGNVRLNEKKLSGGRLYLKGALLYQVLYLSEEEGKPVQSIRGELPFDEAVELPETCGGENITVRAEVEELEVGLIHSRKLAVRALLGILVQADELHDVRTAVALQDAGKVHTKSGIIPVTSMVADQKDIARLREEVFLPSGKDSIDELLYWELELRNPEARAREERLEVQGELSLFALWKGNREENAPESYETSLPFKTEFEIRFEDGAEVTVESLMEIGLVSNPKDGVKILGNGELTKKLDVKVNAFSESAVEKIQALGGKAEVV